MFPHKQLTLTDIFEDCKEFYESDKPQFLTLLENHIDLDEIVPIFSQSLLSSQIDTINQYSIFPSFQTSHDIP